MCEVWYTSLRNVTPAPMVRTDKDWIATGPSLLFYLRFGTVAQSGDIPARLPVGYPIVDNVAKTAPRYPPVSLLVMKESLPQGL